MERVLDELSFEAPEKKGQSVSVEIDTFLCVPLRDSVPTKLAYPPRTYVLGYTLPPLWAGAWLCVLCCVLDWGRALSSQSQNPEVYAATIPTLTSQTTRR